MACDMHDLPERGSECVQEQGCFHAAQASAEAVLNRRRIEVMFPAFPQYVRHCEDM
ncbi:MAG: hypothetical protein ACI4TW_06285 [Prevotella sp.]